MPLDDAKDEHIHIVVRLDQKARWSDIAEENGYDSLSSFVRTAAENQYEREIVGGEVLHAVESMQEELMEELDEMKSTLQLMNEQLGYVE